MKSIIFIFGSNPQISLIELDAVLGSDAVKSIAREWAIAELPDSTDILALQNRLGGTIKIGQTVGRAKESGLRDSVKKYLQDENKFVFGMSAYSFEAGINARAAQERLKNIGLSLKKDFKSSGRRSRFAVSREENLSSAAVVKNKLLTEGAEILILKNNSELIIGRTLTVQDFEKYNLRDYGRPKPSPHFGMLPPKLAQMIINISMIGKDETLLDPFCGSGTILQEAMNLGIENIIGTDKEMRAVSDSQENLTWFQERFGIKPRSLNIFQCDALELSKKIAPDSINAIITEPYLGPLLTGRENMGDLQKSRNDLEILYAAAFQEFVKILKPGGTVVFIFPRFQKEREIFEIRNLDKILKSGFAAKPLTQTQRGSVIYQKDIQHLTREIFVFKKI